MNATFNEKPSTLAYTSITGPVPAAADASAPTRHRLGKPRLLILGCGDVGMRLLPQVRDRFRVFAVTSQPARCADLRAALAASSSGALSHAAHALKGAASNVGASTISDACAALEQSCQHGAWPVDAADQVSRVCDLCPPTLAELQRWLANAH